MVDHLNSNFMDEIERRLRALETTPAMFATSMEAGRFRVGGAAVLLVDSSGGIVVQGRLNGDGTFSWEGPATFDGDVKITENLDVSATTTLRGPLSLLANLVVSAGGKITVGGVVVDPVGGGQIRFGNMLLGPTVVGGVSGIMATSGTLALNSVGQVSILANSGVTITAGDGVTIQSTLAIKDLPIVSAGATVYAVVADAAGRLYRRAVAS
jgi:hypothetical protein